MAYDSPVPHEMQSLVSPHLESFDYFIHRGLPEAVNSIEPVELYDQPTDRLARIWFENPVIRKPYIDLKTFQPLFPSECRENGLSYKGEFRIDLLFHPKNESVYRFDLSLGFIPIMVKSSLCHLYGLKQKQLIKHHEEALEMGGYFICKGNERIVRLLIQNRTNYVFSIKRKSYTGKGVNFSDKAVYIRCVRNDQCIQTLRLYYVNDGSTVISIRLNKREFYIPTGLILKALIEITDSELFYCITKGKVGEAESEKDKKVKEKKPENDKNKSDVSNLMANRALLLIQQYQSKSLNTKSSVLDYLGELFRHVIKLPHGASNAYVGAKIIRDYVLVHLDHNGDKFNLLILMLQKLYAFADGLVNEDNIDALHSHQLILPGHVINMIVKEKLQSHLYSLQDRLKKLLDSKSKSNFDLTDPVTMKRFFSDNHADVGKIIEYFLSTGNISANSSLDLPQTSGFSLVAEKLNFLRYLSHFRSVHRGSFFNELRTTTTRKLLPESWGFMCPVHTPDGSPCGLLNHLTCACIVTNDLTSKGKIKSFDEIAQAVIPSLNAYGMHPVSSGIPSPPIPASLPVLLDGCIIGHIPSSRASMAVDELRLLKSMPTNEIPSDMEVAYIPYSSLSSFPGLFLFNSPARMMRPVKRLDNHSIEFIGTLEQVFMNIRCPDGTLNQKNSKKIKSKTNDVDEDDNDTDGDEEKTKKLESENDKNDFASYEEISPTAMLSVVANLTPWSDFNQSPRNMYQCQMGKQTMGVPFHTKPKRWDNKAYVLQTPQSPIAQTSSYSKYCMDDYPTGTNAVVAVLAHTGYDMEDAMIINKSSMERGFCHGQIYKTEVFDLTLPRTDKNDYFGKRQNNEELNKFVDSDGLPFIGTVLNTNDPYCTITNAISNSTRTMRIKGVESATVDQVSASTAGNKSNRKSADKVNIKLRYGRNPVIGDKFSSRHGQKGVLSQLWKDEDMPFSSVTGMRPDIIINPHAFPSRMTIGMLIESMASKAGAMHGHYVNSTPFRSSVENPEPLLWPHKPTPHVRSTASNPRTPKRSAQKSKTKSRTAPDAHPDADMDEESDTPLVDEFGRLLVQKGYNHYGTEVMYSGVLGSEMRCEIYVGLVYYQRLRHMVSDKFQVRSIGPVDPVTQQPVKGRKLGGGIRFGEMERDALLSHGAAYLLHDRLHSCSDYHTTDVCSKCGSLLSPLARSVPGRSVRLLGEVDNTRLDMVCSICQSGKYVDRIAMPYVFKYLAAELAAMNIKMTMDLNG